MTQYISTNVNLTDNQVQKLRQAINANCGNEYKNRCR